jgi:nicotinate phosphoribosyltransferase
MRDSLGATFTGTSNTYLAYKHDLEAIGTNAHELPMALAAMADNDDGLRTAQYRVLELWQQTYQRELLVMLPDTYGTTQFLKGAPDWVADWTGQRMDSKDPYIAGDEYIAWLKSRGRDPEKKLAIASDGLDVEKILGLHAYFAGEILDGSDPESFRNAADFLDAKRWNPKRKIRFSSGWGTLLTNDFRNCDPNGEQGFDPISLVCKLTEANGRSTVKLSDNYAKAMGEPEELTRYRRVFGAAGMSNVPQIV